jgi:hypothetical protein
MAHMLKGALTLLALTLPFGGIATAQEKPFKPSLQETRKFVEETPELKTWVEATSQHVSKEVLKLAEAVKKIGDGNAFRLQPEIQAGKKLDLEEAQKRQKQMLLELADYAADAERHLLGMLSAADVKNSTAVQKRVLATPSFYFYMFDPKEGRVATTFIDKHTLQDGTLKVESLKTGFGALAFRHNVAAHTINHELVHVLIQGWQNKHNKEQLPLPEDLGTVPMWKLKQFMYVRGTDLLAEGYAELTTQWSMEATGKQPPGATYINQVGSASIMNGIDRASLREWFVGAISSKEFSERFEPKLAKLLKTNPKLTDEQANRGARILVSYSLDSSNPAQILMGRMTDPAFTLRSFSGTLRPNGVDPEAIMFDELPPSIHKQFPSVRDRKKKEEK